MLTSFCKCHCPVSIKSEQEAMERIKSVLGSTLYYLSSCPYAEEATQCSEHLKTLKGHLQAAYDAVEKSLETMSKLKATKGAL